MDSDDLLKFQEACELKDEGNSLFKQGNLPGALEKYSKIVLALQGFLTTKWDILADAG